MRPRRLFIAGSTGATGRVVTDDARTRGIPAIPHARPKSQTKAPGSAVFELADTAALVSALKECTTVLQLIGTMRARFAAGDTYETSDIGTTRQLVEAAKLAGIDHLLLLSSAGAGKPRGDYLRTKAEAERLCTASGVPTTVFRPSFLDGPGRKTPLWAKILVAPLGPVWKVMPLADLSRAMLRVAVDRSHLGEVLEGRPMWDVVAASKRTG